MGGIGIDIREFDSENIPYTEYLSSVPHSLVVMFFGFYPTKIRSDAVTWESHLAANQTVAAISDNARSRASQAMDRERRPPFRDDSVRGMHAYDPQASPTEMRRLSGGLAGLYTEPALALDFQAYRPRDVLSFPADKDRTWRLPTELDPVRLMHNAIRAEVTKFEALLFKLGDDKLSRWQIQCIKVRASRAVLSSLISPARSPRSFSRPTVATVGGRVSGGETIATSPRVSARRGDTAMDHRHTLSTFPNRANPARRARDLTVEKRLSHDVAPVKISRQPDCTAVAHHPMTHVWFF